MTTKIGSTKTRQMTPADQTHWGHVTIKVTAALTQHGDRKPYFSLTAEIGNHACGCLHEEILGAFPELKPIKDLHLSSIDGVPMHAEANGWYWLAGALGGMGETYHGGNAKIQHWKSGRVFNGYRESTPAECLEIFADHCRISLDRAETIAVLVKTSRTPRQMWKWICEGMKSEWAIDAAAGLELLKNF